MIWNRKEINTGSHYVLTRYTVDGRRLNYHQGFMVDGADFDDFNEKMEAQGYILKDSGIYCEEHGDYDMLYSRWTLVKQEEKEE